MKPSQMYTGHVKNGVIVLDAQVTLDEGQAVRVEPLMQTPLGKEGTEKLRQLQQLFEQWTEEDGQLSEEEADCLHSALKQNRGLNLQSPMLD